MDLGKFYLLSREQRGRLLLEQGKKPKVLQEQVFVVPSQFSRAKYKVLQHYNGWSCTCQDYRARHEPCKHIYCVQAWLDFRQYLNKEGLYKETDKALPTCIYCNSLKVVRNGKRKGKQRFFCQDCRKTFVANPEFKGISVEPRIVVLSLDLLLKGLSLRKVRHTLKTLYQVEVSHETIRFWKNRFMKQVNEYVEQFKPELKGGWHTDESKLKSKKGWLWVWNTIDNETKFLVACTISEGRTPKETRQHFEECKANNKGKPRFIHTDGLHTYHKAFNKVFYSNKQDCRHIRSVGFKKNQPVERHHSTMKERTKVMRGLADFKSVERHTRDFRTFYNFVRENQALDGLTPAEVAGIDLGLGENKLLALIKQSCKNN